MEEFDKEIPEDIFNDFHKNFDEIDLQLSKTENQSKKPTPIDVLKSTIQMANREDNLKVSNNRLKYQVKECMEKISELEHDIEFYKTRLKTKTDFQRKQRERFNLQRSDLTKQLNEKDDQNLCLRKQVEDLQHQLSLLNFHQIKEQPPKLSYILKEAKVKLGRLSKNVIDPQQITALDTHRLKQKHDGNFYKEFKDMQSEIDTIELKLEQFMTSNEDTLTDLERAEIDKHLELCLDCKEQLQLTSDNLEKEIRKRYISTEKHEPVDISDIKWRFHGISTPMHVYSFLKHLGNFLQENSITPEWSGKYLKDFTQGKALKLIEDTFPLNCNPPFIETKQLLLKHFGSKSKIMRDIIDQHSKIGNVPDHPEPSGLGSRKYAILQEHCELIESALLVRVPSDDPYEKMCQYTEILLTHLNSIQQCMFQHEVKGMDKEEKFQTIVKFYNSAKEIATQELNSTKQTKDSIINNIVNEDCVSEDVSEVASEDVSDCASEGSLIETSSDTGSFKSVQEFLNVYKHDNKDLKHAFVTSKKEFKNQKEYIVTHVRDNSCALCRFMLFHEKHKSGCLRHVTPLNNTGVVFVESCCFIRDLPIAERFEYLAFLEFCYVCLQHPISACWENGRCRYASKQPQTLMCEKCPNRIITCKDHYESNKGRLQQFKQRYAALGMDINIELNSIEMN